MARVTTRNRTTGGRRRRCHTATLLCAIAAPLALLPSASDAQQMGPKRTLAAADSSSSSCPRFPKPVPPTPEQKAQSRRLAQQGYDAALVGDHTQARDLLRRAAQLDLTSEQIAYRLGREHEEVEAPSDAVLEYCRYLSLAPTAPDARDVRERIARLTPQQSASAGDLAAAQFGAGLSYYERGRLNDAQTAFTQVLAANPDAASAHFNRGLVRAALGNPGEAISDLRRYLALQPQAPDRAEVERLIRDLQRQTLRPAAALGWGAIIPGGGQVYTRRPWFGAAIAAAFVGGIALAAKSSIDSRTVITEYRPPFGLPYADTNSVRTRSYPNTGVGTAVAVSAAAVGAVEAFVYARRWRPRPSAEPPRPVQRVGLLERGLGIEPLIAPGAARTLLGAQLRF